MIERLRIFEKKGDIGPLLQFEKDFQGYWHSGDVFGKIVSDEYVESIKKEATEKGYYIENPDEELDEYSIEVCKDVLKKFKETQQIYIVDHDMPISVSKTVFNSLVKKHREFASKLNIPVEQWEYEDTIGILTGLVPLSIYTEAIDSFNRDKSK